MILKGVVVASQKGAKGLSRIWRRRFRLKEVRTTDERLYLACSNLFGYLHHEKILSIRIVEETYLASTEKCSGKDFLHRNCPREALIKILCLILGDPNTPASYFHTSIFPLRLINRMEGQISSGDSVQLQLLTKILKDIQVEKFSFVWLLKNLDTCIVRLSFFLLDLTELGMAKHDG
ncbi:hypothetical protein CEXT_133271 [Caerostris extrusa]|uniref:Uncharacterized protein n=1 Tax=Caerostris extrusa TaxID=172846 RepID=A0AAV4M2Y2_CAEEX|nr:hypothetical protein CEXT_133271 [Caerostris extrusa]